MAGMNDPQCISPYYRTGCLASSSSLFPLAITSNSTARDLSEKAVQRILCGGPGDGTSKRAYGRQLEPAKVGRLDGAKDFEKLAPVPEPGWQVDSQRQPHCGAAFQGLGAARWMNLFDSPAGL